MVIKIHHVGDVVGEKKSSPIERRIFAYRATILDRNLVFLISRGSFDGCFAQPSYITDGFFSCIDPHRLDSLAPPGQCSVYLEFPRFVP